MPKIKALVVLLALCGCNTTPEELAEFNRNMAIMNSGYRPTPMPTIMAPPVVNYQQPQNRIVNCFQTGPMVSCR